MRHDERSLSEYRVNWVNSEGQLYSDTDLVCLEYKKSTKHTVKILMRRLMGAVSSGFPLFANVCPNLPDVRNYLILP